MMINVLSFIQPVIDFINEKCIVFVDFVLNLFYSLTGLLQAVTLIVIGILTIFGAISVIKKSAKLIILLAAILVIVFIVWTFL